MIEREEEATYLRRQDEARAAGEPPTALDLVILRKSRDQAIASRTAEARASFEAANCK